MPLTNGGLMRTFLLFFRWPDGGAWPNVAAMPLCAAAGIMAAFVLRDRIGRAASSWWHRHFGHRDELDGIRKRLDDHADLLNPETPGGMAAVMAELRDTRMAAESARAAAEALAAIVRPAPRRGATEMRKTAGGKAEGQ